MDYLERAKSVRANTKTASPVQGQPYDIYDLNDLMPSAAPPDANLNADGSWGADVPDPFSTGPDVASWHPGHGEHWQSIGGVVRCSSCNPPRLAQFVKRWIDLP
jgi:hypothetical protein